MGINIAQVLRQAALREPERIAVVEAPADAVRTEHTYGSLDAAARRVAAALDARGLKAGDRVALCADNGAAFVQCWFGIVYAGCTVVPIPVLSAAREMGFRIRHARCRLLIADAARRPLAEHALAAIDSEVAIADAAEMPADAAEPAALAADTDPEAAAMLLYTSGTTGTPKGAWITHASLMTHTAALVQHTLRLRHDDRVLGALPLTHSYGIRMVVLAPYYAGARCVLVPRFDGAHTAALLEQEDITWLPGVPTMFAAWADGPPRRAGTLRWCLSAGAPLPDDIRRRAERRLGAEVRQGYGLTEATFSTIDAPPDHQAPGSVGRPVWGVEVRVVDDEGHPVPTGTPGEIVVRGQNVMRCYLDEPEATAQVMRNGWMHTADVGQLDEAGRLTVVDRVKDLILRGGNNVYPSEVEDALAEHPAVAQVAVVGRPDPHYGEEVVAVVRLAEGCDSTPSELAAWCRERVARYKVPRHVAFVERMPLGPSGKVLKRELRSALTEGRLHARSTR